LLKETYQEFLTMIEEHKKVTGRASTNNELHHMTYKTMREKYKDTAAQLIEQARTIAWKNRKQGKPKKCIVRFDKRLFSMAETKRGNPILSLRLTKRRMGLPVVLYQRIREHIAQGWQPTSVLMTDKLRFYLVISKEDQQLLLPQQAEKNMLGIDVNASKIAVSIITSGKKILKQLYLGKHIGSTQYKFEERRARLQQYRDTVTPSRAGLKLKRLSGKQRRYVRTNIWMLANQLVKLAKEYMAKIAIEALKHLRRRRGQLSKKSRRKANRIPYGFLKHCLMSVCTREGVELVLVNPKHTSQECQKCHHISKKNWVGYKLFRCEKCGFECNRDRNASVNIAARASLFSMHPEQMLENAQISSGGDAAVNRHGLKGEDSVESSESKSCQSFKPPFLNGGS
jgi:putative transposase